VGIRGHVAETTNSSVVRLAVLLFLSLIQLVSVQAVMIVDFSQIDSNRNNGRFQLGCGRRELPTANGSLEN
jgi:hypothetical protein